MQILKFNLNTQANKINENFFDLTKTIIGSDAKQFKNQHPEYFNDPDNEIRQSLEILRNKEFWKERYRKFMDSMVYAKIDSYDYESSLLVLENISRKLLFLQRRPNRNFLS